MGATKPKIAIFSPYLNILGGGEKYILTIAEYFSRSSDVVIFWNNKNLVNDVRENLNIDINGTKIKNVPNNSISFYKDLLGVDKFFYMTDGSLFFSPAKKNYLIIQSPAHIPPNTLINKIKLGNFKIISYSKFINDIIRHKIGQKSEIIAPPVDVDYFKSENKENIILSVGRFFPWLHTKKQEVIISAFKKLIKNKAAQNYKLILIGNVDLGAEGYFNNIKKLAQSSHIKIMKNLDFQTLIKIYGKSKFYWHATGYNEDINKHPEKAEHFGITIVESMSAGCVPLVYEAGGPSEIVKDNVNGFVWRKVEQLLDLTMKLIQDEDKRKQLANKAINDSKSYSKDSFINKIREV